MKCVRVNAGMIMDLRRSRRMEMLCACVDSTKMDVERVSMRRDVHGVAAQQVDEDAARMDVHRTAVQQADENAACMQLAGEGAITSLKGTPTPAKHLKGVFPGSEAQQQAATLFHYITCPAYVRLMPLRLPTSTCTRHTWGSIAHAPGTH
eukprot:1138848-Pelagomonas_calceolata.AAC.7